MKEKKSMNKILIISNNNSESEKLCGTLCGGGYKAVPVSSARTAIRAVIREIPDLIICSDDLAGEGCLSVLKAVRENGAVCDTPFIVRTDGTEASNFRKWMCLGADDCVAAGEGLEALLASIAERLRSYERKQMQCQSRMDELRESIASSMPHEVYTPLSIIFGYTDLLKHNHERLSKSDFLEIIDDMAAAARRIQKMFETVFLYTRLELARTGRKPLDASPGEENASVKPAIESLAESLGREFNRRNDIFVNAEKAEVAICKKYLSRALHEIIDNALKFSEKDTAVKIDARVDNGIYIIRIRDNGRGMTGEQISKIGAFLQFERNFYEQQGQGLGLIIARKITQLYGGNMIVESEYGVFTAVTISLPLAENMQTEERAQAELTQSQIIVDKRANIML